MPLDPSLAALLPYLEFGPVDTLTPERWRGFLSAMASSPDAPPPPVVARVEDVTLGPLPARVYQPTEGPQPTVVYFHGGGWVGGDVRTHDAITRGLALALQSTVVSVDFRRPPEARFPAAFDDALFATRFVAAHLERFGGVGQPLAVAGDSAGANLAAAVALASRTEGPPLTAQLLLSPLVDLSEHRRYASREQYAQGFFITAPLMRWCTAQYLASPEQADDARASPLLAEDVAGAPPAVISTAEFDPARDEGVVYARALSAAGVPVTHHPGEGLLHAFFAFEAASPAAAREAHAVRESFRRLLR